MVDLDHLVIGLITLHIATLLVLLLRTSHHGESFWLYYTKVFGSSPDTSTESGVDSDPYSDPEPLPESTLGIEAHHQKLIAEQQQQKRMVEMRKQIAETARVEEGLRVEIASLQFKLSNAKQQAREDADSIAEMRQEIARLTKKILELVRNIAGLKQELADAANEVHEAFGRSVNSFTWGENWKIDAIQAKQKLMIMEAREDHRRKMRAVLREGQDKNWKI